MRTSSTSTITTTRGGRGRAPTTSSSTALLLLQATSGRNKNPCLTRTTSTNTNRHAASSMSLKTTIGPITTTFYSQRGGAARLCNYGCWKLKISSVFMLTVGLILVINMFLLLDNVSHNDNVTLLERDQIFYHHHDHNFEDKSKNKRGDNKEDQWLHSQQQQQGLRHKKISMLQEINRREAFPRKVLDSSKIDAITSASKDNVTTSKEEESAKTDNDESEEGSSSLETTNNNFEKEKMSTTSVIKRQFSNRYLHHKNSSCPKDVRKTKVGTTLVTQTTLDRLPFLKETCQRWYSPIVVVVCLLPEELNSKWNDIQQRYNQLCPHMKMIPFTANEEERHYKYPINQLRNRGLDQVETSHVFLIDVDFIPSADLDQAIVKAIEIVTIQDQEVNLQSKRAEANIQKSNIRGNVTITDKYQYHALVVPAFERKSDADFCGEENIEQCLQYTSRDREFMPRSMESLVHCMNAKSSECIVFHSDYFPWGHGDTKTEQWIADGKNDTVRSITCIDTDYYEPYLAIPWCPTKLLNHDTLFSKVGTRTKNVENIDAWAPLSPYYDERFYGYGKNKMQHILHLQKTGYAFSVIPFTGFLTHHPHPLSKNKKHWKKVSRNEKNDSPKNLKAQMKRLFNKFDDELNKEYAYDDQLPLPTEACNQEDE